MRTRHVLIVAALGVAGATPSLNADFTGTIYAHGYFVEANDGGSNFDGYVVDVYAMFDEDTNTVLAFSGLEDVNLGTTYWHSATGSGWLPSNDPSGRTDARDHADSFVSIGGTLPGNPEPIQPGSNNTQLDPNFGGNNAAGPGPSGGWYNSVPTRNQGVAMPQPALQGELGVFLGRFALETNTLFTLAGSTAILTWNNGPNTKVQSPTVDIIEYVGEDCNQNGVGDWNDIATGHSEDCNNNTIPDECEYGEVILVSDHDGMPTSADPIEIETYTSESTLSTPNIRIDAKGGFGGETELLYVKLDGVTIETLLADEDGSNCFFETRDFNVDLTHWNNAGLDGSRIVSVYASSDVNPEYCGDDLVDVTITMYNDASDCNENGVSDSCDIADGKLDDNDNGIPDSCDLARGDLDLDGCVGGGDMGVLLSLWGFPDPPIGDLDGDGVIGGGDLGILLGNWDLCP